MKRLLIALFAPLFLAGGALPESDVVVSGAWLRPAPPNAPVAGYFTMMNMGELDDVLLSVRSDLSDRVEVHDMRDVDGVMQMRPLDGPFAIRTGEMVVLTPGGPGRHLMLTNPKELGEPGTEHVFWFVFLHMGEVPVTFRIGPPAPSGHKHNHTRGPKKP